MNQKVEVSKLSTGQDNTLETWINLSSAVFGKESAPTKFLKEKAATAQDGIKAEVIAPEGQLMMVLGQLYVNELKENKVIDIKNVYPFEAYNENERYLLEQPKCLAKAIYDTWNREDDLFTSEGKTIFSSAESIENNIDFLAPYGLSIKKVGKHQKIYDFITDKVYTAYWHKE